MFIALPSVEKCARGLDHPKIVFPLRECCDLGLAGFSQGFQVVQFLFKIVEYRVDHVAFLSREGLGGLP